MSNKALSAVVVGVPLLLLVLVFTLIPETRFIAVFGWNLVIATLVVALAFGGPIVAAIGLRRLIENKDEKHEPDTYISPAAHLSPALIGAVLVGVVWMFVVRILVGLPTWINTLYSNMHWSSGMQETLPWGWFIYAAFAWVMAYFFAAERSREWLDHKMNGY